MLKERFNHLIEFDTWVSVIASERIVKQMSEVISFDHTDVVERYDPEDKEFDITMRFRADDGLLKQITTYLDEHNFKGCYTIFNRLSN